MNQNLKSVLIGLIVAILPPITGGLSNITSTTDVHVWAVSVALGIAVAALRYLTGLVPPPAVSGKGRRYGKQAPRLDVRTFKFERYLIPANLPPVQPWYSALHAGISLPMDGNDEYGCCTIAAKAHLRTIWRWLKVPSRLSVLRDYFRLGHGQDNGLVMVDVLNDWRKRSFQGEKILAWFKIDHRNHDHVKLAMELCKGVYLGFNVQKDCEADFEADRPWAPGPLLNEGHCVVATEHDMRHLGGVASDLSIATWGKPDQQATWAWWDECVDEAYAVVPMEARKTGFNNALNIALLEADLAALS